MTAIDLDCNVLLERTRTGIFRQTLDGGLIGCNHSCARILGYESPDEILDEGMIRYTHESDRVMIMTALQDLGTLSNLEVSLRRKNASPVWVLQSLTLQQASEEGPAMVEGLLTDITDQREAAERFEHQTQHDPITGLPNEVLFNDRLDVALARARRRRTKLAVLYVDLDRFDMVNRSFGQGFADRLLREVAQRLHESLRAEDSVARYASDEFSMLLADYGEDENVVMIAQRVLEILSRPILLNEREVSLTASIGIAVHPTDGRDGETLLRHASEAMYRAKERGRNGCQLYQPMLQARAAERLVLMESVRRGFDNGEFAVHFQPQVDLQTGTIMAVEALLRWHHPSAGILEPAAFLTAAEQAHLMGPIGDFVLREVCRQTRLWDHAGIAPPHVAINLSERQLLEPDLLRRVMDLIEESDLSPSRFEFEVREPGVVSMEQTLITLTELKSIGAGIALDDFGTGRSSLAELRHLPIDKIKIDSSFIQNINRRHEDASMVEAIITMGLGMGKTLVAEGVETREQISFLRARNCHHMQGFFFGRPLSAKEIEPLLRVEH